MMTYLRIINPAIALLVFLLCFYAGTTEDGVFAATALFEGSLATYFFAKGIFCGTAIFLLGKILEVMCRNNSGGGS